MSLIPVQEFSTELEKPTPYYLGYQIEEIIIEKL